MVSVDRVRELFTYDTLTGQVIRNKSGKRVGTLNKNRGYRYVHVDGKSYREHRLIWLLMYGYMPEQDIDHINGVRDDNRLANLRECSRSFNLLNAVGRANNSTGHKGVSLQKNGKYHAYINVNGKRNNIGYFDDLEVALLARAIQLNKYKRT